MYGGIKTWRRCYNWFQGQFLSLGPFKDSFVVGEDVVLMELLLDQEGFVYCGI